VETFAMRFKGGPYDGKTQFFSSLIFDWPLPTDVYPSDEGEYHKVSESSLTEPMEGIMRGANYEWVPKVVSDASDS
jgi:hypothetical protein